MPLPLTQGVHHVGLTVSKLEESASFFTTLLGWHEVRRNPDYPAIFVSDGTTMLSLWAAQASHSAFDRRQHVGLHHLALGVSHVSDLHRIHDTLVAHHIRIEFAPEHVGKGPDQHMMCEDPSGIRIEFRWSPSVAQGEEQ